MSHKCYNGDKTEIIQIMIKAAACHLKTSELTSVEVGNKRKMKKMKYFNSQSVRRYKCREREGLLEDNNLVCLNTERGRRIDVYTGNSSALDLTMVSIKATGICEMNYGKTQQLVVIIIQYLFNICRQGNKSRGKNLQNVSTCVRWKIGNRPKLMEF